MVRFESTTRWSIRLDGWVDLDIICGVTGVPPSAFAGTDGKLAKLAVHPGKMVELLRFKST